MIRKMRTEQKEESKKNLPTLGMLEGQPLATMRYFLDFFGARDARIIWEITHSKKREHFTDTDIKKINQVVLRALKRNFPSLVKTGTGDLEQILLDRFGDAVAVVKTTAELALPGMELQFGLLTPTQYAHLNVAKQLILLISETNLDTVDPLLCFELSRQLALSILSIQFHELNLQNKTRERLAELVDLFEQELITGPIGKTKLTARYGVYDDDTNVLLSPLFTDQQAVLSFWEQQSSGTHIKEFPAKVREIIGFGTVLFDYRPKSVVSAIIKAIFEAKQQREQREQAQLNASLNSSTPSPIAQEVKRPELSEKDALEPQKKKQQRERVDLSTVPDLSGFLFVVEEGKEAELLKKITSVIEKKYPKMSYREKHKTKTNNTKQDRGSSTEIEFKRIMVKLNGLPEEAEIEIMVYNWSEYSKYRLHVGKNISETSNPIYDGGATELYVGKRTTAIAKIVFPETVYGYNFEDPKIQKKRSKIQENVVEKLRSKHADVVLFES